MKANTWGDGRPLVWWRARVHYQVDQYGFARMNYAGVMTFDVEAPENDVHAAGHAAWRRWSEIEMSMDDYITVFAHPIRIDVERIEQPVAPEMAQATLW